MLTSSPKVGQERRRTSRCQRSYVKTKADRALHTETDQTWLRPGLTPDPGGQEVLLSCPDWALKALGGKLSQDFPVQGEDAGGAAELRTDTSQPARGGFCSEPMFSAGVSHECPDSLIFRKQVWSLGERFNQSGTGAKRGGKIRTALRSVVQSGAWSLSIVQSETPWVGLGKLSNQMTQTWACSEQRPTTLPEAQAMLSI